MSKKPIYLDREIMRDLATWAKKHGKTPQEAAERFIKVAMGRLTALETYNAKFAAGKAPVQLEAKARAKAARARRRGNKPASESGEAAA